MTSFDVIKASLLRNVSAGIIQNDGRDFQPSHHKDQAGIVLKYRYQDHVTMLKIPSDIIMISC